VIDVLDEIAAVADLMERLSSEYRNGGTPTSQVRMPLPKQQDVERALLLANTLRARNMSATALYRWCNGPNFVTAGTVADELRSIERHLRRTH
jgi:hypothetical protein